MSRFCGRCDESVGEQVRPAYKTYFGRSEHYRSTRGELIKIGAKVVSDGRYIIFQMAKIAMSRQMFREILSVIARLRAPPAPAAGARDQIRRATKAEVPLIKSNQRSPTSRGRLLIALAAPATGSGDLG